MWDSPHAIHHYHLGMVNKARKKMLMCGMVRKITTSKTASISELEHVSHFGTYLGGQFIDHSSKHMGGSLALKSHRKYQEIIMDSMKVSKVMGLPQSSPWLSIRVVMVLFWMIPKTRAPQGSLLMSPAIRPVSEGLLCRSRPPVTEVLAVMEAMVRINWHLQ